MFTSSARLAAAAAIMGLATGAAAQTSAPAGGLGGRGGLGGLGGLLGGGGIPNVASVGVGNAAGLLGYCLRNNLLGTGAGAMPPAAGAQVPPAGQPAARSQAGVAQTILQRLTGQRGVTTSPGFAAGQAGQVQTGGGQGLSLDSLGGQLGNRVCGAVLNRARSFL